jgi:hypothetical protein
VLRFSDARNFGRTLTGLLLFLAPATLLVAQIISPNTDHKDKLRELNAVAAHKGIYLFSGLIFLLGGLMIVAMGVGVMRLFRGPRGVTLGQVSGALLMLGGFVTAGWYALGAMEYEMVNHGGLDRQALATFLHKSDQAGSLVPLFLLFLIGVVIGSILLAVANWRVRVAPIWASVAILVGGVAGALANGRAIEIVTFVLLLVGTGAIGTRVLAMTDEEWDTPRERSAPPTSTPSAAEPVAAG